MHVRRSHSARLEALDATLAATSRSLRVVCARLARFGVLAVALSVLSGCGSTGGGSAAPSAGAAIAVDPVYLDPGQTVARLAWAPSEGPVDNYLVFESRNGSAFAFSTIALTPTVDIAGQPGDSVQITVIAISPTGTMSENSPPSPPLIFQADAQAAVAQPAPQGLASPTSMASVEEAVGDDATLASNDADAFAAEQTTTDVAATQEPADDESARTRLEESVRSMLLGGDARLPEAGLSVEARDWLQARVDEALSAGVSLAGTGRANDDALRELVWQDAAGQLFVSDGETFLRAEDPSATLTEGVRLNATERFVGLADFDGDGLGDWLLEDTATGAVWIVSDLEGEAQPQALSEAALSSPSLDATLAGHGDFDGDGIAELLWTDASRRLTLSGTHLAAPHLAAGSVQPADTTLLAIADLDGNGRDDLLTRAAEGHLVIGFSQDTPAGAPTEITWQIGAALPDAGLDLVATVDVDDDGAAEIAWLSDGDLEIWSADGGLHARLD